MKSRFLPVVSLLFVFCISGVAFGQQPSGQGQTKSADSLRETIDQFEKSDINSRSATVQDLYSRTLSRLYAEFSKALEQDISDLSKMEAAVRGTEAQSEVAAQLKKLVTERDVVNEKLKTITNQTVAATPQIPREPQQMLAPPLTASLFVSAPMNSISTSPPVSPAAPPPPLTITGTVEIKKGDVDGTLPAKNVKVVVSKLETDGKRTLTAGTVTRADGTYTITFNAAAGENYILTASIGDFSVDAPVAASPVDMQLLVRPLGGFSRAIVGLQQTGASSARSTQRFFGDLTLSAPLPWGKADPFFGRRARIWNSSRITSVPQQITTGVAEFAGAFAERVGEVKVNEVAQGIEALMGTEFRLTGGGPTKFGTFGSQTSNRFSLSLIIGAGIITPFNPRDTIEIFKVFGDASGLPAVPEGKEFIAFVSPDRDRFFRQYYGGLRIQAHYADHFNPDIPLKRYPATFDITFGQNESVTGGRLRGGVMRFEGFYPLAYNSLKFINLFATAIIKPTRTNITDPLILEPAPSGTTVPADNVFLHTVPQINRDYYRVGVGIDFISLISKWKALQK